MSGKDSKELNVYEKYLTFCIDLKKTLGIFLERMEKAKIAASTPKEKLDVGICYERASALHDVVRAEIASVPSLMKDQEHVTTLHVIDKEK